MRIIQLQKRRERDNANGRRAFLIKRQPRTSQRKEAPELKYFGTDNDRANEEEKEGENDRNGKKNKNSMKLVTVYFIICCLKGVKHTAAVFNTQFG